MRIVTIHNPDGTPAGTAKIIQVKESYPPSYETTAGWFGSRGPGASPTRAAASDGRWFALDKYGEPVEADTQAAALAAVASERVRQDAKWGPQNHPDGTGADAVHLHIGSDIAKSICNAAAREGRLRWAMILAGEVAEALEETGPDRLRAKLIQVADVAVAWIEAIDRRGQR